ncbi:hypothetical protein MKW92_017164 [Papaver armeniacum]|nr:hypothetical protein MKW92_017164 [Papaver armeniacum]
MGFPASGDQKYKFLIYGKTGWIGIEYVYGSGRLEDRSSLASDLENVKPTHVFNAAGVTVETIRTNVVGTLTLADLCRDKGLVLINYATGCIFEYDDKHTLGSGVGFKEEDTPNFIGSFYSKTKAMVSSQGFHLFFLFLHYDKVVDIPNSMTILDELLPISIEMAKRNLTGIWNFTNPGVVSHNEILQMYKDYIDPSYTWKNFNLEEQAKLDASKLKTEFPRTHVH